MEKLNLSWLKQARRSKHLSVKRVAASIGKTRGAVWRYDAGVTDIPVRTLCKLLNLYGVSVVDVFCQEVDPNDEI